MHRVARRVCLLTVALAVGSASTAAVARPSKKQVKKAARLDRLGKKAYVRKQYDDAIAAFEAAYDAHPKPAFLFNLARCLERKGDLDRAIGAAERYLDEAPDGEEHEEAEALLDLLRVKRDKAEGSVRVESTPPGATVRFVGARGGFDGVTPLTMRLPLGSYEVTLVKKGFTRAQRSVEVEATQEAVLEVVLERPVEQPEEAAVAPATHSEPEVEPAKEEAVERPPPGDEGGGDSLRPGWLVACAGVAAVAGGAVFGLLAGQAQSDRDALIDAPTTYAAYVEAEDKAKSRGLVANVLYGVGGLTVAAGAVLLLLGDATDASAGLTLWPGGAGVVFGGTL